MRGEWSRGGASIVLEAKSRCIFWNTPGVSSPSHIREEQDVAGIILGTWLGEGTGWHPALHVDASGIASGTLLSAYRGFRVCYAHIG